MVGLDDGAAVGAADCAFEGALVGLDDGAGGFVFGAFVGLDDGAAVGAPSSGSS